MSTPNTLTIDLPPQVDKEEARFMIYASLFGKGIISSGAAASFLHIDRKTFLERVSEYGISVFSEDEEDLEAALGIKL
jgi:predicted HTH domain antitoxin